MADDIINLDDILGELSCLEEQLDIQQEEFARATSQIRAHELGADRFKRPPITPPPPPSSLHFSRPINDFSLQKTNDSLVTLRSPKSPPEYCVPTEIDVISRGGSSAGGSQKGGYQDGTMKDSDRKTNSRHYAEIGEGASRRQSQDSSINGVAVSGSSSRSSTQSFGSDCFSSDPASARLSAEVVSFPGVLSESLNSFGTISSQGSHSSASSGNSASPGKTVTPACFRVFSTDGTSKTISADRHSTAGQLCEVLARKNHVKTKQHWALVEQVHDLYMERIVEDHQLVCDVVDCWVKESTNRLLFAEAPQKYTMFNNHQVSLEDDSYVPDVEGVLYLKAEGKKSWKKMYFVLRASGLYYSTKGKAKSTADLVCLQPLRDIEIFTAVNWKKKHRSPTEFGFALKMPMIQKCAPKYIRYLCAEDSASLWQWLAALRFAKHGKKLLDNFKKSQSSSSANVLSHSSTIISNKDSIHSRSRDQLSDDVASNNGNNVEIRNGHSLVMHSGGERFSSRPSVQLSAHSSALLVGNDHGSTVIGQLSGSVSRDSGLSGIDTIGRCGSKHVRSSSIDRLLDDSSERGSKFKPAHVRSNSSDRLLDSGRCSNIESSEDVEYSTMRRRPLHCDVVDGSTTGASPPSGATWSTGTLTRSSAAIALEGTLRRNSTMTNPTPTKMVPRLPISTNITRQMSMQQPYDVRTLPRPPKKNLPPVFADLCEDSTATETHVIQHRGIASPKGRRKTADDIFSAANLDAVASAGSVAKSAFAQGGRERGSVRFSSDITSTDEQDGTSVHSGEHEAESRLSPRNHKKPPPSALNVTNTVTENKVTAEKRSPTHLAALPAAGTREPGAARPPTSQAGDARRSSALCVNRPQRVPSPDFPPPPPPEFLHAFQPSSSSGWHQPDSCGVFEMSFEANLENELEFLEQQVSHLDRSPVSGKRLASDVDRLRSEACLKSDAVGYSLACTNAVSVDSMQSANKSGSEKQNEAIGRGNYANRDNSSICNGIASINQSAEYAPSNRNLCINHNDSNVQSIWRSANDNPISVILSPSNERSIAALNCVNGAPKNRAEGIFVSPCYSEPKGLSGEGSLSADADKISRNGTLVRQKPPAPPRRMDSTKLSSRSSCGGPSNPRPETQYFIDDLDRVISQKQHHGAGGIANLEVPLPPPPPLILEDLTCVDFGDLPPPPTADLLAGLRTLRRTAPPRVMPKQQ